MPTLTPELTTTPTETPDPTATPTATPDPTPTPPTNIPTTNPAPSLTPTVTPSPTPIPTLNPMTVANFQLQNGYIDLGTLNLKCWVDVNITKINDAIGYMIQYKITNDTYWTPIQVAQSTSDDIIVKTGYLLENKQYDFRIMAYNVNTQTQWSSIQQIKTIANTVPYPAPTNVQATGILDGILIDWDDVWDDYPFVNYMVYNNTVNDLTTATRLIRTANPWYTWMAPNSNSYVPQYFWVSSISPSNIESAKVQANSAQPTPTPAPSPSMPPSPSPTPMPVPITYLQIGVPYKASDNLTVTLTSLNVIETDGSYQYKITYTLKNENPDTEIGEGQFKAYYADGAGGLPQYGFFGSLFYGQSINRSYTFEELKSKPFGSIAYGPDLFFSSQPPSDALVWKVNIPSV
ncbi:MAG: hypothetical protein ACFCUE_11430 [Candidatus Bathyarchaeia archaeon]|jgi:hypothetical protein